MQSRTKTTFETVLDVGYKGLAQGWWTATGFVVGFAGVFLGAYGANYFGMFVQMQRCT